ncbi:MAG: GNAT family protein [Candidatus Saganbacteria bacterium]|nr:GNAT family protein [Candidatus Saganbacteria bacterium]
MDFSKIKIRKITLDDSDTDFVVSLRNDPIIRERFFSTDPVTRESHLKFLANSEAKGDMVFIVEKDGEPIGQVAIFNIDAKNKKVEGGAFVLKPDAEGLGIGAFVEYNMLDFAFSVMGVNRVHAEALDTNVEILKLHKNFGFREEGRLREHVIINGEKHDVYCLGLLKNEWDRNRFKKLFGKRVFNG